jgi:WD40 repeat protein
VPDPDSSRPALPSADWAAVERLVERFEDAWRRGERPALDEYLPADGDLRRPALLELVHTDLEYRLNAGEAVRVEEYLRRFPELAGDRAAVLSLVAAEDELLRQKGRGRPLDEYLRRFPAYREELAARLAATSAAPVTPETRVSLNSAGTPDTLAPPASPAADFPSVPGYEILRQLGRGGMGIVYEARQTSLGRRVALKTIRGPADPEERDRFRFEAEAVARLQHPNVVQIHEVGECRGVPYLALELVEGGTLAQRLAGAPLPPAEAARLVETLARAVHAAHGRGVLHRDLKPANVLLTADGTPKVTDFGLAKRLDADAGWTRTGVVLGTPSYMAPEQAAGQVREVGPHTDVYALGAILYECLTGRAPFRAATTLATLELVRTCEPVAPRRLNPKLPRDLETICLKAMAREPARRYAGARDLADDLRRFLDGKPITARPVGHAERLRLWARRRPALAATYTLVLIAAGLSAAAAGVTWLWRQAEQARADAVNARRDLEDALGREQQAKRAQEELARQLELARYLRNVDLAYREYLDNRMARGDQLLRECPEDLRGWEWRLVHRLCHTQQVTDVPYSETAVTVTFSPDGRRLAALCSDRTVKVWDVETSEVTVTLTGLPTRPVGLGFSPDGETLITLGGSRGAETAVAYDLSSSKAVRTVRGPRLQSAGKLIAAGATLSPDGSRAATFGEDNSLTIWDTATGQTVLALKEAAYGPNPLSRFRFSPDGTRVASFYPRGTLRVWDVATGKLLLTRPQENPAIYRVDFSPDGKTLAVILNADNPESAVRVWDVATGREVQTLRGHRAAVLAASFGGDGRTLVSAAKDMTVRVWDWPSAREVATLPAHADETLSVAVSPDARFLAAASKGKGVELWDTRHEPGSVTLRGGWGHALAMRFAPDGQRLLFFAADRIARAADVATGRITFPREHPVDEPVFGAAISPDGLRLATASMFAVKLWDLRTGWQIEVLRDNKNEPMRGLGWCSAALSPDGRWLAAGTLEGQVQVWDTRTGAKGPTLGGHKRPVLALAFSPDGRLLAVPSRDQTAVLYDTETWEERHVLRGHTDAVQVVAFSVDGERLATASADWTVKVWDVATAQVVRTLRGHGHSVNDVAFSPDGRRLASGSADYTVKLWDVATGQEYLTLKGHDEAVFSVCFSPDGRRLASSSGKMIMIWDAGPGP